MMWLYDFIWGVRTMNKANRWLLPDGIDEVLPPQAMRMESLRRALLDLYYRWGYDPVMPPPVEFLESLLTGTGSDLDLQTFKLTDRMSGRTMGISADVTPQVARMDAHSLRSQGPARLCYCTHVLRATPDPYQGGRSPVQVGLELFGCAGVDADLEIVRLVLASLALAGAHRVHLVFGHVGVYRGLVKSIGLDAELEAAFFEALERKSLSEVDALLDSAALSPDTLRMLKALPRLNGGIEVLEAAAATFRHAPDAVKCAIDKLKLMAQALSGAGPQVSLYFDLGELRGYEYHTDVVFAVYVPEFGHAVARGGRYDAAGSVFGRARPATGCTLELKLLTRLDQQAPPHDGIWAPADSDAELDATIEALRAAGERVVRAFPGQQTGPGDHRCNRTLIHQKGAWCVVPCTGTVTQ